MTDIRMIKHTLSSMIKYQLTIDLIDGRKDNDCIPFTDKEVTEFLIKNQSIIQSIIDIIYHDYSVNNQIEDLNDPKPVWIREYVYEYIDPFLPDLK